ncbi:tetratricopeptide repeat protein [Parabacteroides chinchillae]
MGFLKSLFSSAKAENPEEEKVKNNQKNFDILKYDGVRAQKMGRVAYAVKCFTEALNIQEDFETMTYLVSAYIVANEQEKALAVLDRMVELEPDHINTLLTRVNILFLLDKDAEAISVCQHVIELDATNHVPHYLMAKTKKTTGDLLGAVVDLTKTIALKDDFFEAYLLRAEVLLSMSQLQEALADVEKVIESVPEEESAFLLRGRIYEAQGNTTGAMADFEKVLELNPFNEDASLLIGKLLIVQDKLDEAISFFDDAIDMNPAFGKAYAERGRAKNMKGDKEGAFEDLKKSIELNPEGEEAKKMDGQHTNFENKSYMPF